MKLSIDDRLKYTEDNRAATKVAADQSEVESNIIFHQLRILDAVSNVN